MEYSNPFDAPQGRFFILKNAVYQYSLWPEHCTLPAGWQVVCEPAQAEVCHSWLKENWRTLQPAAFVSGEVCCE